MTNILSSVVVDGALFLGIQWHPEAYYKKEYKYQTEKLESEFI